MVGMRMVEANDVLAPLPALALNADQLFGIDVVAIVGGISTRIASTGDRRHRAHAVFTHLPEQHAAAFVRISLLAVLPEGLVFFASDGQHENSTHHGGTETQRKILGLFSFFSVSLCLRGEALSLLPRISHSSTCRRTHTE